MRTLKNTKTATLRSKLTNTSAHPSCSAALTSKCHVTTTLALDMNPNLPIPSFSFLPGFVPHLPAGFSQPFHVPLAGVSPLPRISSPPPPRLRRAPLPACSSPLSKRAAPAHQPACCHSYPTVTRQSPFWKFVPATFLS